MDKIRRKMKKRTPRGIRFPVEMRLVPLAVRAAVNASRVNHVAGIDLGLRIVAAVKSWLGSVHCLTIHAHLGIDGWRVNGWSYILTLRHVDGLSIDRRGVFPSLGPHGDIGNRDVIDDCVRLPGIRAYGGVWFVAATVAAAAECR
jgi:hypothetical protein